MTAPAILPDGHYCPACGYDQRGLTSDRCPECGLPIDKTRSGIIAWEQRITVGYFSAFFGTLVTATFRPTKLARSTGWPVDLRSARLFRWIVRAMLIVPCVALFCFAVARNNNGLLALQLVDGPQRGTTVPFWEAQFIWTVGATMWPVLPIGFILTVIMATGISHWFRMSRMELIRQNRAMAFSFYLCSPLAWIFIPCIAAAGYVFTSSGDSISPNADTIGLACLWIAVPSFALIVIAMINSVRAVSAATQCGIARCLFVAIGVILQAAAAAAIGLAFFPALIGLLRLMIDSLSR